MKDCLPLYYLFVICVCAFISARWSPTLCDPEVCSPLLHPWDLLGKNTGVGSHFLLQGIFLT